MFTIIGGDGKEYGPVTSEQIRSWIAAGRANLQTQVRREGETEWTTAGAIPELAVPPAQIPAIVAPVVARGPVEIGPYANELIQRAKPLDIFGCLGRSFELWKANLLPLVGVTLLIFLVQFAVGLVPILGALANLLLQGILAGGMYYYYLGKMRGAPREVSDGFAGFSKAPLPLMATSLMITFFTIAIMLPFFAPFIFILVKAAINSGGNIGTFPAFGVGTFISCVVGAVLVMYLSLSWVFSLPLVIDQGLGPWTAMEVSRRVITKQWFRVFIVLFLGGLMTMLGLIGLIIGVLFTIPLSIGALLYAYEDLCSPPKNAP